MCCVGRPTLAGNGLFANIFYNIRKVMSFIVRKAFYDIFIINNKQCLIFFYVLGIRIWK